MPRAVAVVINYNYGRYLGACLASVDAQSYDDLHVVIVDDCSTDDSRTVIESWSAATARSHEVIWKTENRGPAHSYNVAVDRLQPDDLVAFIDADDMWLPDKFAVQAPAFEDDVAVVYSDILTMDSVTMEQTRPPTAVLGGQSAISRLLARGSFLALNSAIVRASTVTRIDETMRLCDLQMWLHVARHGRFKYLPHEVGVVRIHSTSMSRTESLIGDRLRLLARHARGPEERAWARVRGRNLLKSALITEDPPTKTTVAEYGLRCRDPLAAACAAALAIPGSRFVARSVRA